MIKYYSNRTFIFIEGNVPSLKNSKQFISGVNKQGQKYTKLIPSKTVKNYLSKYSYQFLTKKVDIRNLFLNCYPAYIGFYFIRNSKHRFDYNNATQIITDLLVEYGIFDDDNSDNIVPVFLGYEYNKENHGVRLYNCGDLISKNYILQEIKKEYDKLDYRDVNNILIYDKIIKLIQGL